MIGMNFPLPNRARVRIVTFSGTSGMRPSRDVPMVACSFGAVLRFHKFLLPQESRMQKFMKAKIDVVQTALNPSLNQSKATGPKEQPVLVDEQAAQGGNDGNGGEGGGDGD